MGSDLHQNEEDNSENKDLSQFPEYLQKVSPSICKILMKGKSCMGFLLKLSIKDEDFFCLIANSNDITEKMVISNEQILFYFDNQNKIGSIFLNEKERYIKHFNNSNIITIEILPDDGIEEKYFLSPDINDYSSNQKELKNLINKEIITFGFIPRGYLTYFEGTIKKINDNNEFIHSIKNKKLLKGSPILLKDKNEIIGINKGPKKEKSDYCADFIGPIYNYYKEKIEKIELGDNEYYIGETNNGIPNGKGKYKFANGEIYVGDIINDKFEGNGKYIFENGEYYIGLWKNDLRWGKGILYYKNGNIKYEGDFVNDNFEGNGKLFFENGEYYIGQFKNDYMQGKGELYYKDKKIKYKGEFNNDTFEGNGIYIWENGEYYEGQFLNNNNHGKGKIFYSNKNLKYEGDFVNDKYEGNGKYIWEKWRILYRPILKWVKA